MIYELTNTSKVKPIFEGWNETLIYSCLQKVMGEIFVTDPDFPVSAMAYVGCFAFYAGMPDKELVMAKPKGFVIMTPQNKEWEVCIEACFPAAKRVIRYAIKKVFLQRCSWLYGRMMTRLWESLITGIRYHHF